MLRLHYPNTKSLPHTGFLHRGGRHERVTFSSTIPIIDIDQHRIYRTQIKKTINLKSQVKLKGDDSIGTSSSQNTAQY